MILNIVCLDRGLLQFPDYPCKPGGVLDFFEVLLRVLQQCSIRVSQLFVIFTQELDIHGYQPIQWCPLEVMEGF